METKRICKDICKEFRVSKPTGKGRYDSGHCLCLTCDIWMDHNGCHLKDGKKATAGSEGWFCNCCNIRVRRNPRNIDYKAKLRSSNQEDNLESHIDLSYFNKRRAIMLKKITQCIAPNKEDFEMQNFRHHLLNKGLHPSEIEKEFNGSIDEIVDLAYTLDPPNKISMIVEFERIRTAIGETPTEQHIDKYSKIGSSQYGREFESWGHMLERLGYDPFYRDKTKVGDTDIESTVDESLVQMYKDRLNILTDKTMHLIKSSENGMDVDEIKRLLEISQEEMFYIYTKVVRARGIITREIERDGGLNGVLLRYDPSIESDPASFVQSNSRENSHQRSLEDVKKNIQDELKDESVILSLFDVLDQNIGKCDKDTVERVMDELE